MLSHVQLFATTWTVAHQAPLSIEFSRQEYWNGLPCPSPGDPPNPSIESGSLSLKADSLPFDLPENPGSQEMYSDDEFFYCPFVISSAKNTRRVFTEAKVWTKFLVYPSGLTSSKIVIAQIMWLYFSMPPYLHWSFFQKRKCWQFNRHLMNSDSNIFWVYAAISEKELFSLFLLVG